MDDELTGADQIYERLWSAAAHAFESGRPGMDPHLPDKSGDQRRGITLLFRPGPAIQRSLKTFMGELAGVAPGQYFYKPEEWHVTVLAIVPGSNAWQDKMRHLPAFRSLIGKVLEKHRGFSVGFRGVTASANAVMIQGFPNDGTLGQIRDRLRSGFRDNQMGDELDRRYKILAAHMTVMRFCRPDTDWKRLKALLEANRTTPFGETRVHRLQLVSSDWYASAAHVQLLEEYPLAD